MADSDYLRILSNRLKTHSQIAAVPTHSRNVTTWPNFKLPRNIPVKKQVIKYAIVTDFLIMLLFYKFCTVK